MIKTTKLRKIHIDNLPADRIYILFRKEFHIKVFNKINEKRFNELNLEFFENKLNWNTFKQWKSQKHFIPLWYALKLYENKLFSLFDLEKNILEYKGPSTSNIIKNPNFPLIEDQRMIKITAHLLGDGSVGGGFGSKYPKGNNHSEYRNFNINLLKSFQKDLSVFGDIETKINVKHGSLIIPNLIGYILSHIYNIKFDTFNSRVPKHFFKLDIKLIGSFLRAFGDDEGYVYDSSIEYYSNNKLLLKDIFNLIKISFPAMNISSIYRNQGSGKNPKYSFKILCNSQKEYLDKIGFDHPQKEIDLQFNLSRTISRG